MPGLLSCIMMKLPGKYGCCFIDPFFLCFSNKYSFHLEILYFVTFSYEWPCLHLRCDIFTLCRTITVQTTYISSPRADRPARTKTLNLMKMERLGNLPLGPFLIVLRVALWGLCFFQINITTINTSEEPQTMVKSE